ncbi:MAG: hypothetical protein P0Y55_08635 [Candidatus Cohnella colombiensis]|uniref:Uncharacterized protein n=1 Tax=Candidatus Cohnella colombiensis TaxID=3121368 RepID=A0AA95EYZ8_9BACL|nr:MAG: hypothetical protein P0Y55_08635 [Cohnella sp.]
MQEEYRKEYKEYLMELFSEAAENSPIDFIYSLLRVTGLHFGHWDPYVELRRAFEDYNKILSFANEQGGKMPLRVGLLMYCQAIEMTAIHELLANIFRCKSGLPFVIKPFMDMQRPVKKRAPFSVIPPSANSKIKRLKKMASESGDTQFEAVIESFYDDQIRNAFVHSDYCITDDEFRWTEGGNSTSKDLSYISEIITRCFAFYEALFNTWKSYLQWFKTYPRFTKMPQFEVFELLTNEEGLFGFAVHFSNGQKAFFERHEEKVDSCNLYIEKDGSINFFVGDLEKLEKAWKVDGKEFE